MNEAGARQQIVEKIKNSSNILVTVSADPSVDELSAALGLTVLLNNMNKHATAVFSGQIPAAMDFLDPQKTFSDSVDSLRDFIIALDKEKADHLRYKVEGEVVKIFVTPYRTTITSDDLEFSQGDFNVDLVLALGVTRRDNLDVALTAHGRILHDATVATLSVGEIKSELGSINWREQHASSLGEMLVSVSEALKSEKADIDEQIATAFLTGIVAATDRFSNKKTSSKAMTVAAQLMAAGANQQLIASKLEEAEAISTHKQAADALSRDEATAMTEGESQKLERNERRSRRSGKRNKRSDGALVIDHGASAAPVESASPAEQTESAAPEAPATEEVALPEVADQPVSPTEAFSDETLERHGQAAIAQQQSEAAEVAEQSLAEELSKVTPAPVAETLSVDDLRRDIAEASADVERAAEAAPIAPDPVATPEPVVEPVPSRPEVAEPAWQDDIQPTVGGTLNATTEQAADDKRREEARSRNRTILTHGTAGGTYVGDQTPMTQQSPINAAGLPSSEPALPDPFARLTPPSDPTPPTSYAPAIEPLTLQPTVPAPDEPAFPTSSLPTLAELEQQSAARHDDAQAAVDAALSMAPAASDMMPSLPFDAPPLAPASYEQPGEFAPPLPPLPDFSTLPPLPPLPGSDAAALPPLQDERLEDVLGPAPAPAPQAAQDPGQFRIPGQ